MAWLSLDENDSQPFRFFTYVIAAIQTAVPGLAAELAASLRSPNPPDETAIVPALLNELAGHKEPFIQHTSREAEILALIAAGLSNKQIEETLFISKNTVRTHIKNLYSKLAVTSRTQAINRARELRLLE